MDKVRELDTFYRVAVAFGFCFMCLLILLALCLLAYCIFYLVNYYKSVKEKKLKRFNNLSLRVSELESKVRFFDTLLKHFDKGIFDSKEDK